MATVTVTHRIAAISFRRVELDCTCGDLIRGDRDMPHNGITAAALAGTPEALRSAFAEHRRLVGAPAGSYNGIGYGDSEGRWNGPISAERVT